MDSTADGDRIGAGFFWQGPLLIACWAFDGESCSEDGAGGVKLFKRGTQNNSAELDVASDRAWHITELSYDGDVDQIGGTPAAPTNLCGSEARKGC